MTFSIALYTDRPTVLRRKGYTLEIDTHEVHSNWLTDAPYVFYELTDPNGFGGGETMRAEHLVSEEAAWRRALAVSFPERRGGNPGMFVGEGIILCAPCGHNSILTPEDDAGLFYEVHFEPRSDGETCAACCEYIYPPFCAYCGMEDNGEDKERQLIGDDTGEKRVCRQCLAEALWRGRGGEDDPYALQAELIGVNAYEITAGYTRGAYRLAR